MIEFLLVFAASYVSTFLVIPRLIPRLQSVLIVGRDMNKPGQPEVPEMGGLGIIMGFVFGVLVAISLSTFGLTDMRLELVYVLAALSTILIMAIVGVVDDLLVMQQHVKAMLPLFAALPLVAVKMGVTHMEFPILGVVDFGLLYPLLLIPVAITGASNATNMLAGFNGLESGLGAVMCATISVAAYLTGGKEALVLSLAMLGALLAFLHYNRYPAKILIGDVGTLSIGAVVAVSVIIGNFEKVGIILFAPFFLELVLKMRSRFKAQSWCGISDEGRLVCPERGEVYGCGRLVMYLTGGVSERNLVLVLVVFEVFLGVLALMVLS